MMRHAHRHLGHKGPLTGGLKLLLGIVFLLVFTASLDAQVINESTPQDSIWVGVGADSADFVAQSFVASIRRVRKIGVWLQGLAGSAEVRLAVVADDGGNRPDLNAVLHESVLIAPDTAGAWVWDSTFSAVFTVSQKYWIVIDGYNNLVGTGYAGVGTSNSFTSTSDPLRYSTDGGMNWASVPSTPLAVHVEGDNCTFGFNITPTQPLLCPGGTVSFGVPNGLVSYIWGSGQTSSTITIGSVGVYSVTAVDTANCTATASVLVVQGTIPYTGLLDFYESCEGFPLQLSVPPFYQDYSWSNGASTNATAISQSGIYWVSITSTSGCVTVDSFEVYLRPLAQLDLGRDSSLCMGDSLVLVADPGYLSYLWSTGATGMSNTLFATTAAWLQVVDSAGCATTSDTVQYDFNPLPAQPTIQILPSGLESSFANAYAWTYNGQPLQGANAQNVTNPIPGLYTVMIANAFGCRATSDTVRVAAETPGDFVSGGFSPNADGVNDVFFIEGISRYPDCALQVFNRWSQEVYNQRPYQNTWDGTGKSGQPLPVGDYFFILDFGAGRETLRGTVLISR
jgi:gliding motility-associated-like protein